MTIFESSMSSKYFGRELELPILRDLGRVLVVVLALYGILKFEDLYHRGVLKLVFVPGYEQRFFLLEIFLSVVAPLGLLLVPKIREQRARPLSGGGADPARICNQPSERRHYGSGKCRRRALYPEVDGDRDNCHVRCAGLCHLRLGGEVPADLPRREGPYPGTPQAGNSIRRSSGARPCWRLTTRTAPTKNKESPASYVLSGCNGWGAA